MATRCLDLDYIGRPKAFEATGDARSVSLKWSTWLEEFEAYADSVGLFLDHDDDTNTVNQQQRRALLLYTAGREVRTIFRNLPNIGTAMQYNKAVDALNNHFIKKTNSTFLRHQFRLMFQTKDETVSQYVFRLREASQGCEFPDVDNQIKDQVIAHCLSDKLRRRLLERGDNLTLEHALTEAAMLEAVSSQVQQLKIDHASGGAASVSRIRSTDSRQQGECYRCGSRSHYGSSPNCPARGKVCKKCGGRDHFKKKCRSKTVKVEGKEEDRKDDKPYKKRRQKQSKVKHVEAESESDSEEGYTFMTRSSAPKHKITITVGGVDINVIVDSGSDVNIIDRQLWEEMKKKHVRCERQSKCSKKLFPYACQTPLETIGSFIAKVTIGQRSTTAKFVVIKDEAEALLSRDTATALNILKIGLDIQSVKTEIGEDSNFITEFKPLFTGFGKLHNHQVKLTIDPKVKPVAQPVRRTPFGLRKKVEEKIQDLLDKDIIEPVDKPSPWVSPIVIVPKPNDDIRVTVDMRRVNEAVLRERHPIPTVDELLQDMAESRFFSKLDLKLGYHQLELHPDSREITTFVSHCGLFRYKRLVMGINAASEIYQHEIQQVVQGIPGVANLSDDILVHAATREEHDMRLRQVLQRLQDAGLTLNADKCRFRKTEIEFLGHRLTANGINPAERKVEAIKNAREPETVSEVRSFLGLVNYCSRFIPNFATLTEPLRRLTRRNQPFVFGQEQRTAFQNLKDTLASAQTLGYYDPKAKTQIVTDASPVGVAGILVQKQADGPRIIAYASRCLTDVERRYSQTEKEALAIVWACEKFHPYVYGLHFELHTDHKPLQTIYGPRSKPSARIERWVLRLQAYKFSVIYIPGKENIADSLSRLLKNSTTTTSDLSDEAETHVHFITANAVPSAVTAEELEQAASEDEELQAIRQSLETGRWKDCHKLYNAVNPELCIVGNLVLRGSRIVVPAKLRPRILALAHEGHLGIVGTKQNLRTKVWWPGMEKAAEKFCKSCQGCQLAGRPNPPEPVRTSKLPSGPWEDIALDFLGPLPSGHSVLVVIDYYSRFYEIAVMKSTTSEKTVKMLKIIFARHGLPLTIHSDNGPQFVSDIFATYMKDIGAEHIRVTPRWPQANGEVERQNQSLLKRMKIAQAEKKNWQEEVLTYIAAYRAMPHPSTGRSPAELLYNRKLRTKIPELQLFSNYDQDVRDRDAEKKGLSKLYADEKRGAKQSDITLGDTVLRRQEIQGKLDTPFHPDPCKVIQKAGSKITVETPEGATVSRNSSFFKKLQDSEFIEQGTVGEKTNQNPTPEPEPEPDLSMQQTPTPLSSASRPVRAHNVPKRFQDFVMDK